MTLTALQASPVAAQHGHHDLPDSIALPNGWQPEGITTDRKFVYSGSLADGSIFRADVRTGVGKVLATGAPGRVAAGLDFDKRRDLLWVVGGPTGEIRAQDADTGKVVATYEFPSATPRFLNDVVVTHDAVFATDSFNQELAVIPLEHGHGHGHGSKLPPPSAATTLPLSGDVVFAPNGAFNLNGIVESRHTLISVQSNTGLLFRINEHTGVSRTIDLHGALVTAGDGLELDGRLLYVGRNVNEVDAVTLSHSLTSGNVVAVITDPTFDVPTTVALARHSLFVINARFGTVPPPGPTADTPYSITRVDALHH
jgi:sugar lactone lactonase YvrE